MVYYTGYYTGAYPPRKDRRRKRALLKISALHSVFYKGTPAEWDAIDGINVILPENVGVFGNAEIYYYSENEPLGIEGNWWHYVDGEPTPWHLE